jgi:hypothetical protein
MLARQRELQPHDQRFDPTEHEEGEGGDEVHDADLFVIDGREPAAQPGLGLPHLVQLFLEGLVVPLEDFGDALFALGNGQRRSPQ